MNEHELTLGLGLKIPFFRDFCLFEGCSIVIAMHMVDVTKETTVTIDQ